MTRQQILAESIRLSHVAFMRYAKGFDEHNHVKQAINTPNHFAWTVGHLSLTMHRVAERLDGKPLPGSDFLKADGRGGSAERFDTESISFGSRPASEPAIYPTFSRCLAVFQAAVERCADAFGGATDAQLDTMTRFGSLEMPMWQIAVRMVTHNGFHAGQVADLRRALGMGSIFA